MRSRTVFEGAGLALFLLYPHLTAPLSPGHSDIYNRQYPMNTVYGALLIWILVMWLVWWAVDSLLVHFDPETEHPAWAFLFCVLLFQFFRSAPSKEDTRSKSDIVIASLHSPWNAAMAAAGILILLLLLRWWSKHYYQKTIRTVRILLIGIGLCMVWVLPDMLLLTLHRPNLEQIAYDHPIEEARLNKHNRRIVWVLMDELSYRLAIEAPPPDLSLKHFAEFRNESFEFTNVKIPSYWTMIVIPGVMLGKPVNGIQSNIDGLLWVHTESDGWEKFDEQKTFFAEAKREDWTTGLVGYYNPYCRILPTVLDHCKWSRETPYLAHMSPYWSILKNTYMPLRRFGGPLHEEDRVSLAVNGHSGENMYVLNEQIAAAHDMLDDSRLKLLFIHLAIPHPPGQYVPQGHGGRIATYKENLQLADKVFGELRERIAKEQGGDDTTIILTSDHSWRTWHWRGGVFWNKEDEAFSRQQGIYDERPVLMVHLPGDTENHRIDAHINEVKEFNLIEKMLNKENFTDADMYKFARACFINTYAE